MQDGYIDWNCHLLSDSHDIVEAPDDILQALSYLCAHHRLRAFSMMPTFLSRVDSVSAFLIRRDKAIKALLDAPSQPKSPIKILSGASVALDEGLYEIHNLNKLTVPLGLHRYLPIQLPLSEHADWIDYEINRILYKAEMRILFLSFDLYCILYPESMIEKLTRISSAAYQFSYHSLTDERVCRVVSNLLHRNATVLLGTSLHSSNKAYHYDLEYYLNEAKQHFSLADYAVLTKTNQRLPHKHAKSNLLG